MARSGFLSKSESGEATWCRWGPNESAEEAAEELRDLIVPVHCRYSNVNWLGPKQIFQN